MTQKKTRTLLKPKNRKDIMLKRTNSKGFSTIGIIAIVLVIAVIGLAGWYVWNKNHKDNTTKVQDKTSQKGEDGKKNPDKPSDPSENGKYLVIKEWGVRFLLPETLRGDVVYGIESLDNKETVWFEVGKIAKIQGSKCVLSTTTVPGATGKRGGIGAFIVRTPDKIPQDEAVYYYSPATNIHIDNHWYTGGLEKQSEACIEGDENQQLASDVGSSLTYSLEKLEKVQH